MAEVRWTEQAASCLEQIHDYIAEDRPDAAIRVVRGIYDRAQTLADFPEIGHRYRQEPDGVIRVLLYGHYRIPYRVEENGAVTVLGVFHGAMDLDRYL